MLVRELRRSAVAPGARVLELGTGTGAVAVAAARGGARQVVAVDVAAGSVLAARLNTRVRGLPVQVRRGDLFDPVAGERFDVIVANPPYVVGDADPARLRGRARAWEAGRDGRWLLDRICAAAPEHLTRRGTLLLMQSSLCGVERTLEALEGAGLRVSVAARAREPFGPVMLARAAALEARGLLRPGQRHEDLVVVRADVPADAADGREPPGPARSAA
ncbi:HemK2/MTQ2 family protein methyltransferase [Actinomadura graeca]|nr:HemK2/MTQ2 family protein methyltransferase [Actinomadura graeca]